MAKYYYKLERVSAKEVPDKEEFVDVGKCGTVQIDHRYNESTIYICTDGSEYDDEELRIMLDCDDKLTIAKR